MGKTEVIAEGRLTSYLYDFLRARKDGVESTGNGRRESFRHLPIPRMTNTYIAPGESEPDAIIGSVKSGFYAKSFAGGQVDPATGELVHDLGACTSGQPTLWIGDFNASPGTGLYRAVSALGLIDLFAWPETHAGSWPNGGGWPRFAVLRLDHAFASPGLDARAHMRSIPGSDHRAVVVDWMR